MIECYVWDEIFHVWLDTLYEMNYFMYGMDSMYETIFHEKIDNKYEMNYFMYGWMLCMR